MEWKNEVARAHLDPQYSSRLELPEGMVSGLYKYVVFEWLEGSTGRVYDEPCHRLMGDPTDLPNTDWVARNHSCVPLYYRPDERNESSGHRRVGLHRLARGRQAARARLQARDLRPAALALARAGLGRDRARLDHRPRDTRARTAQLRCRGPPRRRGRRQRRPRRTRGRRARQRARDGHRARGCPPGRRQANRLREHDLGVLGLPRGGGRRGHAAAGPEPPLHEHEACGRAVLQGLPGALRDRLHDPALRHPVRAARP